MLSPSNWIGGHLVIPRIVGINVASFPEKVLPLSLRGAPFLEECDVPGLTIRIYTWYGEYMSDYNALSVLTPAKRP